jgi:hypothetical protein
MGLQIHKIAFAPTLELLTLHVYNIRIEHCYAFPFGQAEYLNTFFGGYHGQSFLQLEGAA